MNVGQGNIYSVDDNDHMTGFFFGWTCSPFRPLALGLPAPQMRLARLACLLVQVARRTCYLS